MTTNVSFFVPYIHPAKAVKVTQRDPRSGVELESSIIQLADANRVQILYIHEGAELIFSEVDAPDRTD